MNSQARSEANGFAFPFFAYPNPFQPFLGSFEAAAPFGAAPMKGFARAQLEMMGLMNRRAQAYLEIPSVLSRCRTPQDLFNEQSRFWHTAFQQYAETGRRVAEVWGQMAQPAFGMRNGAHTQERDYITFPEQKPAASGKSSSEADLSPPARRVA